MTKRAHKHTTTHSICFTSLLSDKVLSCLSILCNSFACLELSITSHMTTGDTKIDPSLPPEGQPVVGHVVAPPGYPHPQQNGYFPPAANYPNGGYIPAGSPGAGPGVPQCNYAQPHGYTGNYPPPEQNLLSYGVDGYAQNANPPQPPLRGWNRGLCVCCSDCDSCLEACCCFYPQISRQYNITMGDKTPTINWLVCIGGCMGDIYCGSLVGVFLLFFVRNHLRRKYNIAGTDCNDGCIALCCTTCALQQMLLEMIDCNMFPGACCYDVPNQRTMS